MVSVADIRQRIGASKFYRLLSEPSLEDWDNEKAYLVGDRVRQQVDNQNYFASFKALTDNTDKDPATDSVNWALDSLPAQKLLASAKIWVESFVINRLHEYDEENKFQAEAIVLLSISKILRYDSDDEEIGLEEKKEAEEILDNAFKLQDKESKGLRNRLVIGSANNDKPRTLQEQDPNNYFRTDYSTNDYKGC